jgi:hypothetical protein
MRRGSLRRGESAQWRRHIGRNGSIVGTERASKSTHGLDVGAAIRGRPRSASEFPSHEAAHQNKGNSGFHLNRIKTALKES